MNLAEDYSEISRVTYSVAEAAPAGGWLILPPRPAALCSPPSPAQGL